MDKWETLKLNLKDKSFTTENNNDIKVLGSFDLNGYVFARFSDSNKIYQVIKENENTFKRFAFFKKKNCSKYAFKFSYQARLYQLFV